MKDVLKHEEIDFIATKHTNALKNFATLFNGEKMKKKFKLLSPLKNANFSRPEVIKLNYKAGAKIWRNCTIGSTRNNGGRPKLHKSITSNINNHMKSLSEIAANRFLIKLKKNARYRVGTFKTAFSSYPLKKKISFSTFYKKICKSFKKPYRLSDLCDICVNGKVKPI